MNASRDFRKLQKLKIAVTSAEKSGDVRRMSDAYSELAFALIYEYRRFEEGIAYRQKELNLYLSYKNHFNDYDRSYGYRFLGVAFQLNEDYDKCIDIFKSGLSLLEKNRSSNPQLLTEQARAYYNLGNAFYYRSSKEISQLRVYPKPGSGLSTSQSDGLSDSEDSSVIDIDGYTSFEDESFIFDQYDDLEQSEFYFRLLVEFTRKHAKKLCFDSDECADGIGDESFRILKLTQAILSRFRNAIPYYNNIDFGEVIDLYDRVLEVCDTERLDEIMYRKASALCLFGAPYRAQAVELLNEIINLDGCRRYFKRRAYQKVVSFTLRIGCFSNCIALTRKSNEVFLEKLVEKRLHRIKEIERIFNSDPSDGLAMICCEQGEFYVANDLYSELLRNEKDINNQIDLWMDKEATLERWQNYSNNNDVGDGFDVCRKIDSVVSEIRFSYLSCLKLLNSLSSSSKRYNDVMLEYAKFIAHHNVADAIKAYQQIINSSSSSSRLKSIAVNAIERFKVQTSESLSVKSDKSESNSLFGSTKHHPSGIEIVEIDDEPRFPLEDMSSIENLTNCKRKKGVAIMRKGKVARVARVIESDDTEGICESDSMDDSEECLPADLSGGFLENFTDSDVGKIALYSDGALQAKLKEEKASLRRPMYLTFYNLEIAVRLQDTGDYKGSLPFYEQAVAYCPPGTETRFTDLKNLFFNKGRVHRRLGQWDCAIRNLERATGLFTSKSEALECADCYIELGHLYLDEAEKLELNEYALAFRRCFGRISLKYFESARRLLKTSRCTNEKRRMELLSHVLSNASISWLMQDEKEKAVSSIGEAISHCRQFGDLENWLCQSLNISHDINKSLRRVELAIDNLRDCLKVAKLKGGDKQPSFDYYGDDITKSNSKCFGYFYWISKLNFVKLAIQMHKLQDAKRHIRELLGMSSSFQKDFRDMINECNNHLENVAEKLQERDRLIAALNVSNSENLLNNLRQLCSACEYSEDFENLIIFAIKWNEMAVDLDEKCLALDTLFFAYKEEQRHSEAMNVLHSLCAIQKRLRVNCSKRFLNLYKLALLYRNVEEHILSFTSVVEEMREAFEQIKSEMSGNPSDFLPFQAAMLDIRAMISKDESEHLNQEITTSFIKWKSLCGHASSVSSDDQSDNEQPFQSDVSVNERSATRRRKRAHAPSAGATSRRVRMRDSNQPTRSCSGSYRLAARSRRPFNRSTLTRGNSPRISLHSDKLRSLRRRSDQSDKSSREQRPSNGRNQKPVITQADCTGSRLSASDDDALLDHLQRMLSDDDLFVRDNDHGHEAITDVSSASGAVHVAAAETVSARVRIEQFQFLVVCNSSNDVQWLIDEVASRFFRDQARRPFIKYLLLDGAIIDNSDLVMPLIRSHSDAKFVAVVSHFQEIALSVSYHMICSNRDEYCLNSDIAERLSCSPLQTVDISYIISLPSSITPLIQILPRDNNNLTELIFDCSAFNDKCALLLADVATNLHSVKRLSIANTLVTVSGVSALLKTFTLIFALDTHSVDLSKLHPKIILEFFQSNSRIEECNFSNCQLTRFPLLQNPHPAIRSVNLSGNMLNASDLEALRASMPII